MHQQLTTEQVKEIRRSLKRKGHDIPDNSYGLSKAILDKVFSTTVADHIVEAVNARLGIDCDTYQISGVLFPQCTLIDTDDFDGRRLSEMLRDAVNIYRYYRCRNIGEDNPGSPADAFEEIALAFASLGHGDASAPVIEDIKSEVGRELEAHMQPSRSR